MVKTFNEKVVLGISILENTIIYDQPSVKNKNACGIVVRYLGELVIKEQYYKMFTQYWN